MSQPTPRDIVNRDVAVENGEQWFLAGAAVRRRRYLPRRPALREPQEHRYGYLNVREWRVRGTRFVARRAEVVQ